MSDFDLIVVGAGHAGCEAAAAAARMGRRVALLTFSRDHIARLSCNPAIGGLAKGCLVRELDALGGWMGQVADATTVQFRRLNTRKGLAVQSSRAQVDTHAYPKRMAERLLALQGLTLIEGEASTLILRDQAVHGVVLATGQRVHAPKVLLTTGTFLGALMHRGQAATAGGRIGEHSADAMAQDLAQAGLRLQRLKTGTPPRLRRDSVDWDKTEAQETAEGCLSFTPTPRELPPVTCTLTWTSPRAHELIAENLHLSAMFSGNITGTGARYCPSVEDKIHRFPHRPRHQLFLEPEGHDSERVYISGLSTSLPEAVQEQVIHSIQGLERAEILQYGYAVEYEAADPRDLGPDLQHKGIAGLYLAGQVNGTSGYEEAAVQGFVAGVSAAQDAPFVLGRHQAYIGVLIDDLTTRGVGGEPYRMFSSRAEHRLLLREDNADRRLRATGRALGLVPDTDWARFEAKLTQINGALNALKDLYIKPDAPTREKLATIDLHLSRPTQAIDLMRRPELTYAQLSSVLNLPQIDVEASFQVDTDSKYAGYIEREEARAKRTEKLARLPLDGLDYRAIHGLKTEVIQRLERYRPATLQSAARLPGITPAAIQVLAIHLGRQETLRKKNAKDAP